ncbi:MAG: polysaccharide biosynthesis tyrosine autokinase [Chitinispirillaceae bacterium]|nr:polysaccharide biosynthesis tyrosine autokinase [Chitinispirillaceae bacterium]
MSRRKFNLGDILRKLNEEGAAKDRSSPHLQEPANSTPSVNSPEAARSQGSPPSAPPSALPHQPAFGGRENKEPVYPSPAPEREGAAVAGTHPASDLQQNTAMYNQGRQEKTAAAHLEAPAPPFASTTVDDDDDGETFDIYKYIGILLRRKYAIAFVVAVAALFSLLRYLRSDTYYVANARLLFRPDNQGIINDQRILRYWGDREKMFSTHLELLRSHTVLAMVAENLGGKVSVETINASLVIKQGETDGEKNDIIELTCRHRDAETARDILNELCRSYIDYRRDVNAQEVTRLVGKFEFQIDKLQAELSTKESALREFKETHRMVELSNETNVTIAKLADMETALQQTQLSLLESKERLAALNTQISSQELTIVQSVTYQDPFQNRIADLELELNTLASEYSPEHFKVKMLRQQIDNLKAATADSMTRAASSRTLVKNPIRQTLLQELINLSIEKSALDAKRVAQEQLIDRFSRDLSKLPAMEQRYAYLQRETESLLQTLRMLKGRYEEAKIRRDSEESELKLLELAQTPKDEISSVKVTNILIGMLVGCILGIALALLLEYLDQTIKEPSSIEKVLGMPLLGIVPFIESDNALLEQTTDLTKSIIEPFRALRANLKHIASCRRLQTFIVCSAIKGEGKTTLAANLGITFALDGKKVVLVDGDLRRSQTHALFAISKQGGLADYLLGTVSIDQILKPTRFENMLVVTSGERPHNPAELLGTIRFDRLIEELRAKADIIIFDSPALLPVSDAITMAPKMDGVLFVIRTFWTPLKAAKQALNQLQRIGSHLYGGILNGASHSGKYYPYYYGYYSYKYAYEEDHKRPFSMRETGLRIERSAKERLTSLRFAIPKGAGVLSRGLNRLARKKTFWLLLAILLIVTVIRLTIQANGQAALPEPIVYLGLGTVRSFSPTEPADGNRVSVSATGGTMSREGTPAAWSGGKTAPDSSALYTSVRGWFRALSERRLNDYLSFYDRASFVYEGGGFEQWKETATELFRDTADAIILLDTVRQIISDGASAGLLVDYKAVMTNDTLHGRIATSWAGDDHGWRIVRQKKLSGSLLERRCNK